MVVLVDRTHSLCCLPSSTRYTAGGPAPFSWRSSRRTVPWLQTVIWDFVSLLFVYMGIYSYTFLLVFICCFTNQQHFDCFFFLVRCRLFLRLDQIFYKKQSLPLSFGPIFFYNLDVEELWLPTHVDVWGPGDKTGNEDGLLILHRRKPKAINSVLGGIWQQWYCEWVGPPTTHTLSRPPI